jgi:hypothetical protein
MLNGLQRRLRSDRSERTWIGLGEEGGFLSGRAVAEWCAVERFFGRAVSVLVGRVGVVLHR